MTTTVSLPEQLTRVAGRSRPSTGLKAGTLHDANTGQRLADSASSTAEQVDLAIGTAAAVHADGDWLSAGVDGRAEALDRFADELDRRAGAIAELDAVQTGVPISVTTAFAGSLGDTVRGATGHARTLGDVTELPSEQGGVMVHHVPWGPTALICPWNAPAALAVKKAAYALAAGAPSIVKPSEMAPLSTQLVLDAAEAAGLPDGVLQLVLGGGEVGAQLCADPRIRAVSMTGSTSTGRKIAAAAGANLTRLQLELGSNNPAVVLSDAQLAETASALVAGATKMSGQWCEAPRRVVVLRELLEDLADALFAELSALTWAPSTDPASQVGPVAFRGRMESLEAQTRALQDSGARVWRVAGTPGDGWFFPPTLVVGDDVSPSAEMFGPLLTLQPADDVEQAVDLANHGQVGLAGYVFTTDEERGHQVGAQLEAGEVKVNGTSLLDMAPDSEQSFFGSSGIGGHGDADLLRFFVGSRIVGTDRADLPI